MMRDHHRMHLGSLGVVVIGFCIFAHQAFAFTPRDIYQKVSPGVVFIFASDASKAGKCGTGSIIREEGLVITNAHIFALKGSSRLLSDVSVFLKPEKVIGSRRNDLSRRYKGTIVGYDLPLDLALLRIKDVDVSLTTVDFADSDRVVVGDQAFAIGHPEQGGLWSLTTGVVSAQRQNYGGLVGKNVFQTEASINRGNSGGPLLNEWGIMIGINSMTARMAKDGFAITDVNFSIKSNVALKWLNGLGYRFSPVGEVPPKRQKKVLKDEEKAGSEPGEKRKKPSPKGKILTKKNPYNMDELIAAMQEMEELMEEMRGKIEEFKNRR